MAEFAGWPTVWATCLLWLFGLVGLSLELGFAYLIQRFLVALGLISVEVVSGPRFLLSLNLNEIILLISVVAAARAGLVFAQGVIGGGSVESFSHRMRALLVEDCLNAPSVRSGETLSFFNQRIYTASTAIQSVQVLCLQGTLSLGLLAALLLMSRVPTALMSLVLIVVLLPMRALNKSVKESAKLHADTFSRIMLHLSNVFRNFLLIRLYNLQDSERVRIQAYLEKYKNSLTRYYMLNGLSGAVVPLVVLLNIFWLAFVQGSGAAIERRLAVPYLYLSLRLAQNLAPLVANASRLAFASAEFGYTFDWWLRQRRTRNLSAGLPARKVLPVESAVGWRLKGVTFGYADQPPLFKDFGLDVAPGSLVHVRGASGVGKSTLMRLLVGEASPDQGSVEVELDGEDFTVGRAVARLREYIGYSSTEPYLFEGTVYENVTYGLKTPPDEDFLRECAARAECDFIYELPQQFGHWVDELGQGLSTGQKQRLSLLRALLRNPRALVLDEALSNVDLRTERRILANLIQIKRGCT
ncbi:MAG: ABC transporter ATP-binding protein/permease, partial [Acidobacteria bacterium]|nr:ABC transporter ATP-binding protein/permease [Acidobacteriota bacterium]